MPTIHVEAKVSRGDLVRAASQLEPGEFQDFLDEMLRLRARRLSPQLSTGEAELLTRINQGLPPAELRRYRDLIASRKQETLTPEEHAELLRLTDQVELRDADRMAALTDLAQLRGVTLAELLSTLGIKAPAHE